MTRATPRPAWRRQFVLLLAVAWVATAPAATLPKGAERLRELALPPQLNLTFGFGTQDDTFLEDLTKEGTKEDWIEQARKKLKRQPDDLRAQLDLGRWLDACQDTNAARVCFETVTAGTRLRLEQHPNDGTNLTLLARAVWELGNREEAESLFRRATVIASNDWHCWLELGDFLRSRSTANFMADDPAGDKPRAGGIENLLAHTPSPEDLEQSIKRRNEAFPCFQRAVEMAPKEFAVWLYRGRYLSFSNWHVTLMQHYRKETTLSREDLVFGLVNTFCAPAGLPDFQRAMELQPDCYKLPTLLAWAEWTSVFRTAETTDKPRRPTLNDLPEKSRKIVLDAIQRLKALGESADKQVAAGALTSLFMLKMMTTEEANMTTSLQWAVELNPANEQAWDMLLASVMTSDSSEKFLEICQRRLAARPSPRNHLIVSKAWYRQKRFKEAAEHTEAALKLNPRYLPAALMQVALTIRRGDDLPAISAALKNAQPLLEELTDEVERYQRSREFALNAAIAYALDGDTAKAREILDQFLKHKPDDENAREIRNALP